MRSFAKGLGAALLVGGFALMAQALDKPSIIRIANPGVGNGNRPAVGGSAWSVVHLRGMLEEEFKADGIKVTWNFLRGAGPAVNELYANNLADYSLLGDLPSIIGRASGAKTRVLAAATKTNLYIAVPADSPVQSIKDLKGKRFAVFKGTCLQLSTNRILESQGLAEKDLKTINMDNATMRAALVTGDVDAGIGLQDILQLRDQGAVRIIYSTKGDPRFTCNSTIIGNEDFIKKYPDVTKRFVRTHVRAAKWLADREKDPNEAFKLWTRSGTPFSNFREDAKGESVKERNSPLIDPYLVHRYKQSIQDAKRYGLIRNPFELEPWIDRSYLDQVLKEEKLENFWSPSPPSS
ncbi:MAG: ABC transporter substrate-binding protein [Polyangiales bacterium]